VGVSRREFLYAGGAAGAGAALFVFLPKMFKPDGTEVPGAVVGLYPQIEVAKLSELQEGVPVFFDYPQVGQANILVKMGEPVNGGVGPDGDIVAFSRICTHMGCPIGEYKHDHKILGPCPCHFTTFDLIHGGMVTLGQATQNLPLANDVAATHAPSRACGQTRAPALLPSPREWVRFLRASCGALAGTPRSMGRTGVSRGPR
jgi:arsenite oxidase small subunit